MYGQVNGKGLTSKFDPTQLPKLLNRCWWNSNLRTIPLETTHHAKFYFDRTMWVVSANTQFSTVYCILSWSHHHVHRSQRWTDLYVIWCPFAQGCAFWGFRWYLRGQIPQNPNFGGVNRRFQTKLAKPKNMHIIKTTASIPTKVCTVIKTTKFPSGVVQIDASQIQDGGLPPSCKNLKSRHISAAVWAISTKFGTDTDTDALPDAQPTVSKHWRQKPSTVSK